MKASQRLGSFFGVGGLTHVEPVPHAVPGGQHRVPHVKPWSQTQSLASAHSELGEHLARLGDKEAADAHFQKAYELDPANYSYWAHVGYPPA